MATFDNKTNGGRIGEEVTSTPGQADTGQSMCRETQSKKVNNKSRTQEPVLITRSGWISRKLDRLIL